MTLFKGAVTKNPVDMKIYNIQIKNKKYKKTYKKIYKKHRPINKKKLRLKNKNHKNIVFTVSESHF